MVNFWTNENFQMFWHLWQNFYDKIRNLWERKINLRDWKLFRKRKWKVREKWGFMFYRNFDYEQTYQTCVGTCRLVHIKVRVHSSHRYCLLMDIMAISYQALLLASTYFRYLRSGALCTRSTKRSHKLWGNFFGLKFFLSMLIFLA